MITPKKGPCTIVLRIDSSDESDAEQILEVAGRFVDELRALGHTVTAAASTLTGKKKPIAGGTVQ